MVPYIIDRVAILLEEERVEEMYEYERNMLVVGTKRNKNLLETFFAFTKWKKTTSDQNSCSSRR